MGVALGQQAHMCGEQLQPVERQRRFHKHGGAQAIRLDGEITQMLVKTRAPCHFDRIAGLKQGAHAGRAPAAHETHVAPVARAS